VSAGLTLRGPLSGHPVARAFAAEVHRVHRRYAAEVVAANRLCPFLRDVDTGFGAFVAMLDPGEPSVDAAVQAVLEADNPVIHVVFPLVCPSPALFERFSGRLAQALKLVLNPGGILREPRKTPPVMATFHPELVGDAGAPHRLVAILRRAPDPFVQLIPEGMHEGGTVFAPLSEAAAMAAQAHAEPVDVAQANFDRLAGGKVDELIARMAEIRADRDRSYAPFLPRFAASA
jgi:hypothetical protein